MRRLVALAVIAASAAAAARLLRERAAPDAPSGNGHSVDATQLARLKRRIEAAGGRVRGGLDSIRGTD